MPNSGRPIALYEAFMLTDRAPYLAPVLLLLLFAACGPRPVPPAALAPDEQFERGMAAYEAGQNRRALDMLQPFVRGAIGDPRVPEARYVIGSIHMDRGEYLSAADAFQLVATQHGGHDRARDARFMVCEAYSRLSPQPALDQQYTEAAIAHCESVAQLYPDTERAEQARERIGEMRIRLARKLFENGEFYLRRRAFDAAILYFEEAVENYPDTPVAPAALLRMAEAYEAIRYTEEAEAARERLVREYPDSPEAGAVRG